MVNLASEIHANDETGTGVATDIKDRLSQELVFALIGPVASGVSTVAAQIEDLLKSRFGYKVCEIIKPSDIIENEAHRVSTSTIPKTPISKRIQALQNAGNELREKYGNNYLIEKSIEKIVEFRKANDGYKDHLLLPGRRAYIIDSLKNPEELELLKQIYGATLCVFGVFSPDEIRRQRLIDNGAKEDDVRTITSRDDNEVISFGQKTRKIFEKADFFICNDQKEDVLRVKVQRYLDLIFGTKVITPNRAESAMYEASSIAVNSGCMSRQVGAAIVSKNGELISVGWNDVPKFTGGLYCEDDQYVIHDQKVEDLDNRCFKWKQKKCHNEIRKNAIIDDIIIKANEKELVKKDSDKEKLKEIIQSTDISNLIEFSRSIHAEMEAILAVAREGKHSLVGSTLYSKTYPCHNCARHIVAAGIKEVIYIEPYRKSLATDLHSDAVTENPNDKTRVIFRQYDGVAPRKFRKLFTPRGERKEDGYVVVQDPKKVNPVLQIALDSNAEYEAKVIADLEEKEHSDSRDS
ncbi:anti-phage dCTP deaminase [Aestuariispira ectoiniformans]|uniref:anti-phage dCTP deaminase n=1 Tax=Aestuariispira ectoiniformans TaxID=2775080 RepID=UPI00223C2BE3|nr:anti-phage dCTP deaminase [Aestuariispira ectoiniformans]